MKCPICTCDMDVWQEVFGERHSCSGDDPASNPAIVRLLTALRQHGIPCFLEKDLTTPELEDKIMGRG